MLIIDLILFVISCIVLVLSGALLVKSLKKIAGYLHMSEFVVGFVLMAFATSVPELFVGISSALNKASSLALGNVIGANILNLSLIVGIIILLGRGIKIKNKRTKVDALYMAGIVALPIILTLIKGVLSRLDGVILLAAFLVYARKLYKEGKLKSREYVRSEKRYEPVLNTALFIAGLGLLFISSKLVVKYATSLSYELQLPPILIGLFLISIGTTLPELTFESRAILTGHPEMALGNLIGSVVVNSTLVLGITAIIFPITSNVVLFFSSSMFMLVVAFLFATFVESGNKLYIREGMSLILLYILFVIIEFYIKGLQ